ncbi:PHP domain-containing protein [Candidatus Microgenomates bacterium]|nr:PHP domain-containing protein [Candidatus Microgenomates bacterium]
MTNLEIAELLRSVAAAYELKGKGPFNRFKIGAYQKAADSIEHSTMELKDLWEEGKLDQVPGIGSAIAKYLGELFKTGKVRHFHSVMQDLPSAMFTFMQVPGIGAKIAYKLCQELKIHEEKDALKRLEELAKLGKIREIEGLGTESEAGILRNLQELKERGAARMLLPVASSIADDILVWLKKTPAVLRADPLGSLRRHVATVGDVDISVASDKPREVIEHFKNYPKKVRLIEAGPHTSSILVTGGAQVDLMVQPPVSYGALLAHFTGSKHHNIALREFALRRGLSLSEYGIKKLRTHNPELKTYRTEDEFYRELGLDWIEPELREDTGEIEASYHHKLPKLVKLEDIKGDFHLHSSFSIHTSHDEGLHNFAEMVKKAESLGYEYLGFSEHNPSQSGTTKNEVLTLLKRKKEAIEKLKSAKIHHIFNGLEVDITPNGKLALPNEAVDLLDYMIVSVHSSFRLSKSEQTKRVLAGLSHPKAKIFGHPTGRRLNKREGIELDWEKIFAFCEEHKKLLEINSWYDRLDLPDNLVREAVKRGIKMIINTDSHQLDHMELMRYGVFVARRGWAEKDDIVNTLPYIEFKEIF